MKLILVGTSDSWIMGLPTSLYNQENLEEVMVVQNISVTRIMFSSETLGLGWEGDRLASKSEFLSASRDVGSIFEALEPGEEIELAEGIFVLDHNLDPEEVNASSEEDLSSSDNNLVEIEQDLGMCILDVFRQPGDLYSSWDIVQAEPDGSYPRLPNAFYGPGGPEFQPEEMEYLERHLIQIDSCWDCNGWRKRRIEIKDADSGELLAYRQD